VSLASGTPFGSINAFKVGEKTSTTFTHCSQFHFHAPSEHTVDGEMYDLEMHTVCYYEGGSGTGERNYAVLGFMFEEGDENEFIKNVIDTVNPSVDWTLLSTYPNFGEYYTYDGSLTTPDCNEIVTWLLTSEVLEVSSSQLSFFTSKWANDPNFGNGNGNNRPVQPINGRTIFEVNADDDDYSVMSTSLGAMALLLLGINF
jgi:carbonic anhydrase